jgi:hypothetical protein
MAHTRSHTTAFLAGILFCPPYANTTARLVAGPDVTRFNHLFDATTDMLMEICRTTRLSNCGKQKEMVTLPAEPLADLMMGLALQLSLVASHLADCQGWETDDFEEILNRAAVLPPPLNSVFQPDLRFWECLLNHRCAPEFLDAFEDFGEYSRIRCVAVLTSAEDPDVDIDRFIKAADKKAFISDRLRTAAKKIRAVDIDNVPRLKQAIAWSIAASAEHPTCLAG